MSGQLDLFDAPATRGASRESDPWTSRAAGRSMSGQVLRDQQADVLRAIRAMSRQGLYCTAFEVWQHMTSTVTWRLDGSRVHAPKENVISKRLGELRDLGMIQRTEQTRPGSSRRPQFVYALTQQGREVAA